MSKIRLDDLLVRSGLAPSRDFAMRRILAGEVLVDNVPVDKPGTAVSSSADIRLRLRNAGRFVSRGGDKLAAAIEHFSVSVQNKVVLDIGSSTGGFADCFLQHGAAKVYCVDVGTAQLHDRLRHDPRIVVFEQQHAQDLQPTMFNPRPQVFSIDVSFIAVTQILDSVLGCLEPECFGFILVKPQFELPRDQISPGGVVLVEEHRLAAVEKVREGILRLGYYPSEPFESPIRGEKKGNQEYFVYVQSCGDAA